MKNAYNRKIDSNPRVGAQKLRNRMFMAAHASGNIELCHKMTNHGKFTAFISQTKDGRKGKVVKMRKQRPAMVWRKFKKSIGQNQ